MGRGALTLSFRKFLIFSKIAFEPLYQVQDVCNTGVVEKQFADVVARKCHILQVTYRNHWNCFGIICSQESTEGSNHTI